jgi:hypothetical protein
MALRAYEYQGISSRKYGYGYMNGLQGYGTCPLNANLHDLISHANTLHPTKGDMNCADAS